jgi:hypothetical protein
VGFSFVQDSLGVRERNRQVAIPGGQFVLDTRIIFKFHFSLIFTNPSFPAFVIKSECVKLD